METYTVHYYDCGVAESKDFRDRRKMVNFLKSLEDDRGKVKIYSWECKQQDLKCISEYLTNENQSQ